MTDLSMKSGKVLHNWKRLKQQSKYQTNFLLVGHSTFEVRISVAQSWFVVNKCFANIIWTWFQII